MDDSACFFLNFLHNGWLDRQLRPSFDFPESVLMANIDVQDNKTLASLALALVDEPRASLSDLARSIGISKATLYRFCRTREELIERLVSHCKQVFSDAYATAGLDEGPVLDAFRRLTDIYLNHKELTAFLTYYWREAVKDPAVSERMEAIMDAFFLRGQREGFFRVDIPAPALTEIWGSMVVGIADAERRGRVARAGLQGLIENAFLQGVANR